MRPRAVLTHGLCPLLRRLDGILRRVREVFISGLASSMDCCFLKANVTPSQRTTAKLYEAWVLVHGDGSVRSANCTCMDG
ncbi:hypothetical protein MRX96_057897 [Rhipicephalus microplus]